MTLSRQGKVKAQVVPATSRPCNQIIEPLLMITIDIVDDVKDFDTGHAVFNYMK